jgi:GNAT superfamily N-acetyltransferase
VRKLTFLERMRAMRIDRLSAWLSGRNMRSLQRPRAIDSTPRAGGEPHVRDARSQRGAPGRRPDGRDPAHRSQRSRARAAVRDGAVAARCARDDHAPEAWDFGIVVADAWQGIGLGEALLTRLITRAEASGIAALSSVTLPENAGMLTLARRLGFKVRREPGDATLMRVERQLGAAFQPPAGPSRSAAPIAPAALQPPRLRAAGRSVA